MTLAAAGTVTVINPIGTVVAVVWAKVALVSAAMESARAAAPERIVEVVVFISLDRRFGMWAGWIPCEIRRGRELGFINNYLVYLGLTTLFL